MPVSVICRSTLARWWPSLGFRSEYPVLFVQFKPRPSDPVSLQPAGQSSCPFCSHRPLSSIGDEVLSDLPAQLDTAADLTVIPLTFIEQLGLVPFDAIPVIGFGGVRTNVPTFLVSLRGQTPVALEVLGSADEPHVLLGRDMLNRFRLVLDGPRLVVEIT